MANDQNGTGTIAENGVDISPLLTFGDRWHAIFCLVYLLLGLTFLAWLLLDTWTSHNWLLLHIGYNGTQLSPPTFRILAFTILGGALGGVLNGVRSVVQNYQGFSRAYMGKYITAPWTGALLALIVFALVCGGSAVFGGGLTVGNLTGAQSLSNFAIGALVGYGAKDVLVWLDARVSSIFKVPTAVPDVTGKSVAAAAAQIQDGDLAVGSVTDKLVDDKSKVGTVGGQNPPPETTAGAGSSVNLEVAKSNGEPSSGAPA
jgi:hypothetical protein